MSGKKLTKKYYEDAEGNCIGWYIIDDEGYVIEEHYYEDDA